MGGWKPGPSTAWVYELNRGGLLGSTPFFKLPPSPPPSSCSPLPSMACPMDTSSLPSDKVNSADSSNLMLVW
ncbi:hypothetical protein Pmani_012642 [Petrolisthes manimaculis]|uniref:Uncharacterized protein n=1 Tax=Petrolisthes manimaculis TaxID=1843537 RepID=A0AAE1PXG9_9EUCA|nr:hypothetical protein Pmani_012642 [Petrolisthes manimaculis]